MRPISEVTSRAVLLERSDVDTDQIIPASWLKRVERTGFGAGLFSAWREDPSFPLNRPESVGARILVAGPNFGTGSSREHAVWALTDYGFDAVISARFGDIFKNNSTKNGLIPVQLSDGAADELMEILRRDPSLEVTVSVVDRTVAVMAAGFSSDFPLDDFTRYRFLEGLDDIGLTLRQAAAIDDFEARRPSYKPVTSPLL
jgi:3-isopropylmalate/(R)-2-methylmalate dehydratase small subunit